MKTLDQITRTITLHRLTEFGGHREKTAKSLGISVRTLGLWLSKWAKDGLNTTGKLSEIDGLTSAACRETPRDLTHLASVKYEWRDRIGRDAQVVIDNPITVYTTNNGITHRITAAGDHDVVVPAPGEFGCVIRETLKESGVAAA